MNPTVRIVLDTRTCNASRDLSTRQAKAICILITNARQPFLERYNIHYVRRYFLFKKRHDVVSVQKLAGPPQFLLVFLKFTPKSPVGCDELVCRFHFIVSQAVPNENCSGLNRIDLSVINLPATDHFQTPEGRGLQSDHPAVTWGPLWVSVAVAQLMRRSLVDPFRSNSSDVPRIDPGCLGEFSRHNPTLVTAYQARSRPQRNNFVASCPVESLTIDLCHMPEEPCKQRFMDC